MNQEIETYLITMYGLEPTDTYELYDYYRYSDTQVPLKCIAEFDDNIYIMAQCSAFSETSHDDLVEKIERYHEIYGIVLDSLGNDLSVYSRSQITELSSTMKKVLIGVLKEVQKYCIENNKEKALCFSGIPFEKIGIDGNYSSNDIDSLIEKFNGVVKVKKI